MFPFSKKLKEGSIAMPAEVIERKPDEDNPGYEMLDAIAEDLCKAIGLDESKHKLVKSVLQSYADYIQTMDEQQDQQMMKE